MILADAHAGAAPDQPNRSFLFAPGNHPRRAEKAFNVGADAVILDLEDAVAVAEKPAARQAIAAALSHPRTVRAYVRINALSTPYAFADLEAVIPAHPDGLVVPKIESPEEMATAEWIAAQFEARDGIAPGAIEIMPIVETGRGVAAARAIAAVATRVRRLAFGAGDYTQDMGMTWTRDEAECAHARAEIALASRAAGLEPPLDTVWARLDDAEGLAASAARVCAMGYQGKMAIHPDQIAPIHAAFTPSAEEIAAARRIAEAFAAAEAEGSASIQLDGQFIDYPIVAQARRTLALARAAGAA